MNHRVHSLVADPTPSNLREFFEWYATEFTSVPREDPSLFAAAVSLFHRKATRRPGHFSTTPRGLARLATKLEKEKYWCVEANDLSMTKWDPCRELHPELRSSAPVFVEVSLSRPYRGALATAADRSLRDAASVLNAHYGCTYFDEDRGDTSLPRWAVREDAAANEAIEALGLDARGTFEPVNWTRFRVRDLFYENLLCEDHLRALGMPLPPAAPGFAAEEFVTRSGDKRWILRLVGEQRNLTPSEDQALAQVLSPLLPRPELPE